MSSSILTLRSRGASDGSTAPVVRSLPREIPRERVRVTIEPENGDARSLVLDLTNAGGGPGALVCPDEGLVLTLLRERAEGRIASLSFEPLADIADAAYEARRARRASRRAARSAK